MKVLQIRLYYRLIFIQTSIHPADFFPKIRNLGIDFCRRFEYVVRTDGR